MPPDAPITTSDHASNGARAPERTADDKRWALAIGTSIGLQVVGNFKTWVLDRGRLGVAAVQEARGGQARLGPLIGGVAIGVPLIAHGAMDLGEAVGRALHGDVDGAALGIGAAQVVVGGGITTAGMHYGLPNGLNLLKDFMRGPTTSTVPISGGRWDMWGRTFRISNRIGAAMGVLTLVAAGTNIADGVSSNGPGGVINHQSGRSGLLYATTAGMGYAWNVAAGLKGMREGSTFRATCMDHPWLFEPKSRNIRYGIGIAVGGLLVANEFGLLDFMDSIGRSKD